MEPLCILYHSRSSPFSNMHPFVFGGGCVGAFPPLPRLHVPLAPVMKYCRCMDGLSSMGSLTRPILKIPISHRPTPYEGKESHAAPLCVYVFVCSFYSVLSVSLSSMRIMILSEISVYSCISLLHFCTFSITELKMGEREICIPL